MLRFGPWLRGAVWGLGTLAMLVLATRGAAAALDVRDVAAGQAPHEPVFAVLGDPAEPLQRDQVADQVAPVPAEGTLVLGEWEQLSWRTEAQTVQVTWRNDDRSATSIWELTADGPTLVRSEAAGPGNLFTALPIVALGSALLAWGLRRSR